jgi:CDP-glycerol:poly(glycerophosphate) glycerophosphotransferase
VSLLTPLLKELIKPTREQAQALIRVMFFFFKNVHIPILKPIYEACKRMYPEAEIGFACMPYAPEMRAGFLPKELEIIRSIGEKVYTTPQEFRPDITFIADSVYPWVQGCGRLVHVGHGVLSKGQYYTDTDVARREEQADLVCVPGEYHAGVMQRIISTPVVATGMAKLDSVFRGEITRDLILQQLNLPRDFKYILFAPTFNDELSAIPFVLEKIVEVLPDERTCLLIKLHGSTKQEYKELYQRLGQRNKQVHYAGDLDITPFLVLADVMISDVSSAMMEFAALDKPLVLFNNPRWHCYPHYNPVDIEFCWRDIGIEVTSLDEMVTAVNYVLFQSRFLSRQRQIYTDRLFANKYDGRGGERIVREAFALLQSQKGLNA